MFRFKIIFQLSNNIKSHFFILLYIIFIFIILIIFLIQQKIILNKNEINRKKRLVIDAFTYFQESVMLSIRLLRMSRYVDFFLIVVAEKTYSGLPLKISFSPFNAYIKKYRKKIIFHNLTYPTDCIKPWCRENYQRMAISDVIRKFNIHNESIIIISDLDEIPTDNAMNYILKNPPKSFYILSGYMYYYNYRNRFKKKWPGVIVIKALNCDKKIQKYRNMRYVLSKNHSIPISPALTHCSYCYNNITTIQKKIHSFAHTEYDKPPFTTRTYIEECIKKHVSLFNKQRFDFVDYDEKLLPLPKDNRFNYLKSQFSAK